MSSAQSPVKGSIRVKTASRVDHSLFLLTVILGAAAIISLKSGMVHIPFVDVLGILVPVVAMVLYACAVTLIPRTRIRLDQAGDNLYYLGFTYTLCSLAITLYRFHATEGGADYIVSNFGIALATTIVGVVSRVWLHQMRDDPLELEQEARFELTEAVGRLRAEIELAIREFNYFNRTLQQSAQEAIEAQSTIALEALDKSTKQYAEVANRAVGYLESCFTAFSKQAGELNANTADVVAALTALSNRIGAIETPSDLLSAKLAPIFQQIADAAEQTAGRVSSERQRNQNVAKLAARLESITGTIDGVLDKVADREQRISTATQQIATITGNTVELSQHMSQWTERFTEIEAKQAEIIVALAQSSQAIQGRDAARDEALRKAFTDTMTAIGDYEAHTRTMLQRHSDLFESELERAEKAFTALSRTLSEGATLLASELGRRTGH
jgi:hypothetical protein